jgi:hypothetical protein
MGTFAEAVRGQTARTENGMKALASTGTAVMDLYYKVGSARGTDIIPTFAAAFAENRDLAVRTALWARDVREGAGERKVFRDILNYVATRDRELATRMLYRVPELGRWDDLLSVEDVETRSHALALIARGLLDDEFKAVRPLVAKWMPRKGPVAVELREFLNLSPKRYRKLLVENTNVVETKMCARDWEGIDFSKIPSLASARYKKAFTRHSERFKEYVAKLVKGDKTVKVNAGAVYPYDVLKGLATIRYNNGYSKTELDHIEAQWRALPNYVGDARILPLVDVSGSMISSAGAGSAMGSGLTNLDVAVSLGLYLADKNLGRFKDTFLTFSSEPKLLNLSGSIVDKVMSMAKSEWGYSTNLHAALELILRVAREGRVSQDEMPSTLLILSDMQFNSCVSWDDSAYEMIGRKYRAAGYDMPNVVFWNLNAKFENAPVKVGTNGVALVSGFSPTIVRKLANLSSFTPEAVMMETIMNSRYDY